MAKIDIHSHASRHIFILIARFLVSIIPLAIMLRNIGVARVVLQKQGAYRPSHKSLSSNTSSGGGASSFADLLKKGNLESSIKVTDTQPVTQGKPSARKWTPNQGKTVQQGDNTGNTDVATTGSRNPPGQRKTWVPKSAATSAAVPSSRNANAPNKFSFSLDDALISDRRNNNNRDVGNAAGGKETSGNVRDSLRRAAQRQQTEHSQGSGSDGGIRVMGDSTTAEEISRTRHSPSTMEYSQDTHRNAGNAGVLTDARAVRADILDHLANREMSSDTSIDIDEGTAGGIPLDEVEITEGELRYRQYQERVRIEKEQFRRKLPPPEPGPKFRRPPPSSSSSSSSEQSSYGYRPSTHGNGNGNNTGSNGSGYGSSSYAYGPGLGQRPGQGLDATSSSSAMTDAAATQEAFQRPKGPATFDIAELKRQTAERMRQKQQQQIDRQGINTPPGRNDYNSRNGKGHMNEYVANESQMRQKQGAATSTAGTRVQKSTVVKTVTIPHEGLTLRDLASKLSMKVTDLRSKLEELGETFDGSDEHNRTGSFRKKGARAAARYRKQMNGNDPDDVHLDADVSELVVLELGLEVTRKAAVDDLASVLSPSSMQSQIGNDESESLSTTTSSDVENLSATTGATSNATMVPLSLVPRAPVVCIMGHVDHGKTTLLDALRRANVAASEAGGITQKLSAFTVEIKDKGKALGSRVVFLDTPGHAAFSAMRSYGASATDMVVLVVALDDGVRPQTKEALAMALEAKSTVIVALNKVDRIVNPADRKAARARVLNQLVDLGLICEDYGGETQVVEVSGRSGEGLDGLVESLLLQADMLELKAAVDGQAEATVLDANMEKGRGVVADVLVQWGSLTVGDPVVIGTTYGRVKAMIDDQGKDIHSAGPSTPVRLLGLRTVPQAGQELLSVTTETKARQIAERRERLAQLKEAKQRERGVYGLSIAGDGNTNQPTKAIEIVSTSLKKRMLHNHLTSTTDGGQNDSTSDGDAEGSQGGANVFQPIVVSVLIKADGVGTLDALSKLVLGLADRTKDVHLQLADCVVGDITRSDVERAVTVGQAVILGFNVGIADSVTRAMAKEMDVKIVRDTVIYRLEDELRAVMESHMPKERSLTREGLAVVQKVFTLRGKRDKGTVAGLLVSSGTLRLGSGGSGGGQYVYRVLRGRSVLPGAEELAPSMLKRFKESVHEVSHGLECGLALENFAEYDEGDEIECLKVEWKTRPLSLADDPNGNRMSTSA